MFLQMKEIRKILSKDWVQMGHNNRPIMTGENAKGGSECFTVTLGKNKQSNKPNKHY